MATLDVRAVEKAAVDYLLQHLGERGPRYLRLEQEFVESPLEGEGPTALFSFDLEPGDAAECAAVPRRHYVAAGATQPNFFPAYGMTPDDAYSLHVGTRFMLELGIQKIDDSFEPPGARAAMRKVVAQHAPGTPIADEQLAALFKCDDSYFAVYRVRIGDLERYFMGADCPHGFYDMTEHPPQAALRLHLGKLIRREARQPDPTQREQTQ